MKNDIEAYLDTSILAAYYCPERLSDQVERVLLHIHHPIVSALTEVELFSAISRKIRKGHLTPTQGKAIGAKFNTHLEQQLFMRMVIAPYHYQTAKEWIGRFTTTLKTLDALHLALAFSRHLTLLTADEALARSAKTLGVPVRLIESP